MTSSDPGGTARVIDQFNQAFQRHDPSLLPDLVAEDCVLENTVSAPDGDRHEGRTACLGVWQGIAADREGAFELEEVRVLDDHAIVFWRYRRGTADADSVRGVNVMRVRGGRIVEGRGYVKASGAAS
ncbi:nuclear transport factor 2 family protein [Ramlibacter sp.]|uniref:nuclear transport factor 2 family protein n=1 Tax=Ramlibacter sp. TaxID=1917967 RepID=UPI0025FCC134|nr:nuclear transport factor 2 family protein [Ramlibacter sp.]